MNRLAYSQRFFIPIFISFVCLSLACTAQSTGSQGLKLWYQQPANAATEDSSDRWIDDPEWLKALPLGNGSLGAMVFGDVCKERIQLSEESMWSGSPDDNDNPDALPALAEIRRLLFENKHKEATELTKKTQICKGAGSGHGQGANVPFGCFQTLGDLWIDFENKGAYQNYHRELDLEEAVARVSYKQDEVNYKREIFVSYPTQLMVVKLTADKPNSISFKSTMTRPEKFETKALEDQLVMQGILTDGKGGEGLKYMARLTALNKNGTVEYSNEGITVIDADEVTLLLSASTSYVFEYPHFNGRDYANITSSSLEKGRELTYESLIKSHIEDYQQYYSRVDFELTTLADTVPTDERLENFKESKSDLHLVELMFQYGRYLLISSSRPGTLPANLQGIWANKIQTPWNGDYHTDVNVQMNYWLAESANLGEMHLPLFDLMETLVEPGSKTAQVHYGAKGWLVHPISNVWGYTSPGESYNWGMHVGGGAWLTTHIMEHYYFTLDKEFLEERFHILEASTQFYMDWLITHPETGDLISGPSVSPENSFTAPDGSATSVCMGPAHDHQVIWQLFKNYIDASNALGIDNDFLQDVIKAQQQIAQPQIGSDGRLMEWGEEYFEREKGHRHVSHLFALHPGYQIDVQRTPELALAARKSLDYRITHGGGHTGWSAAWLVSQYARLRDAENAEKSLNTVLAKSTCPNLFGLHPPFQMDANFGTTAAITEMLIQSQSGEILLLPALPGTWKDGEVKGICARGGFVLDLKWKEGELVDVRVYSKKGGVAKIRYNGNQFALNTQKNKEYFPLKELIAN